VFKKSVLLLVLGGIFVVGCQKGPTEIDEETTVLIQPFDGMDSDLVDTVMVTFKQVYGVQVYTTNPIEIPLHSFVNIKSPRYRADSLIRYLRDTIFPAQNEKVDYVVGLIDEDISTTKYANFKEKEIKEPASKYTDWGIYGLGFCPGKSCIISTHRLAKGTTKENFIMRLKKVSCHELGHNFGLPHCPNKECIMQDAAETIKTIDNVELQLCEDCRKKIGLPTLE
jgi:archaemetzincin